MGKFWFFILIILGLSCNKDNDPNVFTSITGYWIVRTPDNATNITFRIGINSNKEYIIESVTVNHNGSDYSRQPIDARLIVFSPTEIESLTFRTDDFVIRFLDILVNNDFTELAISNSILVFDGTFRDFPMIKATRQ